MWTIDLSHAARCRNNTTAYSFLQADRTEPYTRIEPFQERQDTSVELAELLSVK
jgi:hypothetical protein